MARLPQGQLRGPCTDAHYHFSVIGRHYDVDGLPAR
jgi:hypothetical protein